MIPDKRPINPRIYDSTVTFFEEKIKVYKETLKSIKPNDRPSRRECEARLKSCSEVLEWFENAFGPSFGEKTPTGELMKKQNT